MEPLEQRLLLASLPFTFGDQDGDTATVKLTGAGTVATSDVDQDGIPELKLSDTNNTSSLTISVRKARAGNGIVSLDAIEGTGLKSLAARPVDFVGGGIQLGGTPKEKTTIWAHTFSDGSAIQIGSSISSLRVAAFDDGAVVAPSITRISVSGDRRRGIAGNWSADVTLSGAGVAARMATLGTMKISGALNGATVNVAGTITSLTAARMLGSHVFAGFVPSDPNQPLEGGEFTAGAIQSVMVTGRSDAFVGSTIVAPAVGSVTLASVQVENQDRPFGVLAGTSLQGVAVTNPSFKYDPRRPSPQDSEDFQVVLATATGAAPTITAALSHDTAPGGETNSDAITSDPAVSGRVGGVGTIRRFVGGLDAAAVGTFVDLEGDLAPDDTFAFDRTRLEAINGGPIPDGPHTLHLRATGSASTLAGVLNLSFVLDTTPPGAPELELVPASDTGVSDRDRITSDATPTVSVSAPGTLVALQLDGAPAATGNVADSTTFTLGQLADGEHTLTATATDPAGNTSGPSLPLAVTIDTTPPTVETRLSGTIRNALSSFGLFFNEPMGDGAFTPGSYLLTVQGGGNDGQTIAIASILSANEATADARLATPLANQDYRLTIGPTVADLAGNPLTGPNTFPFTVAKPTFITEISPADGEEMVSPTRRTVVTFDGPVDPVTVDNDSFFLIANGERVPGTIRVSANERQATFLYATSLPPSTEVRVVVEGDRILGRDGLLLDGNGDGTPGGRAVADFRTLPLTRIPGTRVFGFVFDSFNKNPDGSNIPIVGATIRVDAFPEANVVTDANGFFELTDMPAPEFFVHIDGTTAVNAPAGTMYPSVGKPFHSIPGQRTQLVMDGTPFDVFLPPMAMADLQPLSATGDTPVGFGPAGKDELTKLFPNIDPATWDRVKVTYPAGAALDNAGNAATMGVIIPVPPDRLPAPLPPGADPGLVISVQAGDANQFDVPAPITFPNLKGLAPGEKALFSSFNHDAGRWEVIGAGTVSANGETIVSDPGVGIRAPGWHYVDPGTPLNIDDDEFRRRRRPDRDDEPGDGDDDDEPKEILVKPVPFLTQVVHRGDAGLGRASIGNAPNAVLAGGVVEFGATDVLLFTDDDRVTWTIGNRAPKAEDLGPFRRLLQTPLHVEILPGPVFASFLHTSGPLPDKGSRFIRDLDPGTSFSIVWEASDLAKKFKQSPRPGDNDSNFLYGTDITVRFSGAGIDPFERTVHVYRFVDLTDDDPTDGAISFEPTLVREGVSRPKPIQFIMSADLKKSTRLELLDRTHFLFLKSSNRVNNVLFTPAAVEKTIVGSLLLTPPSAIGPLAETIGLKGDGTAPNKLFLNAKGFFEFIKQIANGEVASVNNLQLTQNEKNILQEEANTGRLEILNGIVKQLEHIFAEFVPGDFVISPFERPAGEDGIQVLWQTLPDPEVIGESRPTSADDGIDDKVALVEVIRNWLDRPLQENIFRLANALNKSARTNIAIDLVKVLQDSEHLETFITEMLQGTDRVENTSPQRFINAVAQVVAHEATHTLGGVHTGKTKLSGGIKIEKQVVLIPGINDDGIRYKVEFAGQSVEFVKITAQSLRDALRRLPSIGIDADNVSNAIVDELDLGERGTGLRVTFAGFPPGQNVPTLKITRTDNGDVVPILVLQDGERTEEEDLRKSVARNASDDIMFTGQLDPDKKHILAPGLSRELVRLALKAAWNEKDALAVREYLEQAFIVGSLSAGKFDKEGEGPPPLEGPSLNLRDADGSLPFRNLDFGTVTVDGAGGTRGEIALQLANRGTEPVVLSEVKLTSTMGGLSVPAIPPGTTVQPGESLPLVVTFDPVVSGEESGTLEIMSNDPNSPARLEIMGFGQSPFGDLRLMVPNNNVGGDPVDGLPTNREGFFTVENIGASPLTITVIAIENDLGQFRVTGLPQGFGPGQPIVLDPGQTTGLGLAFNAVNIGLQRADIVFVSDDPDRLVFRQAVVGTGLAAEGTALDWGVDFAVVEQPGTMPQRTRTSAAGGFSFVLLPGEPFQLNVFDPVSGLLAVVSDAQSSPSGTPTNGSGLVFLASQAPDSDGDGLPDDIEFAIGTSDRRADTDADGISDFAAIQQGLNPLGGAGFPTGIIAQVDLRGEAKSVVLEGNPLNTGSQVAYVATGSHGLGIVDISQFNNPIVLGQLDLPGDATDVAVDPNLGIAAVATNAGGLHLVDVSDPMQPQLIQTLNLAANQVEIGDGVAYASVGTMLHVVDLSSGAGLATLALPGKNVVYSISRAGTRLYTLSRSDPDYVISAMDVSDELAPQLLGQLQTDLGFQTPADEIDATLFASDGLVYAASHRPFGFQGGLLAFDFTNPSAPRQVGSNTANSLGGLALNGSGLALSRERVPGQPGRLLAFDVRNPAVDPTLAQIFNFQTPASSLAIGRGIAFAAVPTGLQVINYLPFDTNQQPPQVAAQVLADADPQAPGIQVIEGSAIPVRVNVTDDVQVRNVELIVNGQVVANDVSFPFDPFAAVPNLAAGMNTATLQARATDTGGNATLTPAINLEILPDNAPPRLRSIDPPDGSMLDHSIRLVRLGFSEPLAAAGVTADNFQLVDANGRPVPGTTVRVLNQGKVVSLSGALLPAGPYQIRVQAAKVTDRAGNPLGTEDLISRLEIQPTLRIETTADDVDPARPGLQVLERARIPLRGDFPENPPQGGALVLVNGQVVQNDLALPGNTSFAAPFFDANRDSFTASIAGKNAAGQEIVSNLLTIGLVNDAQPPQLVRTTPANQELVQDVVQRVEVEFSESIAPESLTKANFRVVTRGGRTLSPTALGFVPGTDETVVRLDFGPLPFGDFDLVLRSEGITDRAGNPLGDSTTIIPFTVDRVHFNWISLTDGDWDDAANWDKGRVPDFDSVAVLNVPGDVTVTLTPQAFDVVFGLISNESVVVDGGILEIDNRGTFNGPFTLQNGGRLSTSGEVQLKGDSRWTGGRFAGSGKTVNQGTLTIGGTNATKFLEGTTFENASSVLWAETTPAAVGLSLEQGAVWHNLPGSLFDFRVSEEIVGGTFRNAGTIRNSTAGGTSELNHDLQNSGLIDVQSGSLLWRAGGGETRTTSGTFQVAQGATFVAGDSGLVPQPLQIFDANSRFTGPGTVHFRGNANVQGAYDVSGNTIVEVSPIDGVVRFENAVANVGSLFALRTGDAVFTGDYLQTASQTLQIDIGKFFEFFFGGQLMANRQATLAGTLTIGQSPGQPPQVGDVFEIVNYGSRAGEFTTINGLNLGDGKVLVPSYGPTSLTLTVVQGAPLLAAGGARLASPAAPDLDLALLGPLVQEAAAWWISAGIEPDRLAVLDEIDFRIADLLDSYLGLASDHVIWLDHDAAGHGWFVPPTPSDVDDLPVDQVDLLSVLAHEIGHVLGFDHDEGPEWMEDLLPTGARHAPS